MELSVAIAKLDSTHTDCFNRIYLTPIAQSQIQYSIDQYAIISVGHSHCICENCGQKFEFFEMHYYWMAGFTDSTILMKN